MLFGFGRTILIADLSVLKSECLISPLKRVKKSVFCFVCRERANAI